jgi:hypothetical protein
MFSCKIYSKHRASAKWWLSSLIFLFCFKKKFANPIYGLFSLNIWLYICNLCPIIHFLFRWQLSQEILLGLVEKTNQLYDLALVKYDYAITNFNIQMFKGHMMCSFWSLTSQEMVGNQCYYWTIWRYSNYIGIFAIEKRTTKDYFGFL